MDLVLTINSGVRSFATVGRMDRSGSYWPFFGMPIFLHFFVSLLRLLHELLEIVFDHTTKKKKIKRFAPSAFRASVAPFFM